VFQPWPTARSASEERSCEVTVMFRGDADQPFVHVVMNETVMPSNIGVVFMSERDQTVHSTSFSTFARPLTACQVHVFTRILSRNVPFSKLQRMVCSSYRLTHGCKESARNASTAVLVWWSLARLSLWLTHHHYRDHPNRMPEAQHMCRIDSCARITTITIRAVEQLVRANLASELSHLRCLLGPFQLRFW